MAHRTASSRAASKHGIIVVGRKLEGSGLDQYPLARSTAAFSSFYISHVDSDAVTAFTAEDHAQDCLSGGRDRLVNFSPRNLHDYFHLASILQRHALLMPREPLYGRVGFSQPGQRLLDFLRRAVRALDVPHDLLP
ncbi:hypothetical protein [Mesorhizobium wenxiniae]|uniref:hypothetical protein n=1 Tax=Mesorhizobium wenxiniae TaxID=2014805 RepID=UPI0013FD2A05|nr:hypothetical protein [Mesorhizobium wenxiniae]